MLYVFVGEDVYKKLLCTWLPNFVPLKDYHAALTPVHSPAKDQLTHLLRFFLNHQPIFS